MNLFPQSLPCPWEQLVDPVSRMRGDPGENVGEPGLRVDVVHARRITLGDRDHPAQRPGPTQGRKINRRRYVRLRLGA
jgi:hypothetical protein